MLGLFYIMIVFYFIPSAITLLSFFYVIQISSVSVILLLFSHRVLSDSLRPHGLHMSGFAVPHHLLEFAQVHVHWICDAIQPSHPLPFSPSAFNLSQHQGLFQCYLHQGPKCWSFSFSISPSNEYSGLLSFKIDWFP